MQIGLIAGAGELPSIIARTLKGKDYSLTIVALEGLADENLIKYADNYEKMNIGKVGKIISFLKKNNVNELILTGKVPKKIIYETERIKPDMKALKMLFSAKMRGDNELLQIVENELLKEGIKLVELTKYCPELLTPQGVLTKKKPSKKEMEDILYGFNIAKKIGELDIGQTVVVKDKSVVAVEALEGTDETILRAGKYVEDTVVVKVSKPQQNLKLDPPAVGLQTIINMKTAKARVLALEAKKSIIIQKQDMVNRANEFDIIIIGC
ncbi:MAG: UDP-2,3-diacylglucosamine diphosphatase LpxI [Thermodesulfovibrio sp.]|jgi:DUF1009 family protein|uniref:LpxI family protein n=1 Tax=unclassified Thermodesulfovibrio TaxID=2645936 RepID=UPI00083B2231|nr:MULTISPECIES: UDP-2,3-diacylglucosamine diphosphatase LpxI [unclassified Thermodesulfovibrio]MDI1472888.1 UDP-2,3-diacylglucosamine diphosphatase LpxI [Thermodesulfovibrio sp. 1176]MDI6714871.1 UDP-2,3-diacylglucosamine diphosphatase LpxI [Thermodesulfovibrio sp.]ODA44743.1 Protein of unknown function DUF1009 [Thermodesulfovibrio sp. N1]